MWPMKAWYRAVCSAFIDGLLSALAVEQKKPLSEHNQCQPLVTHFLKPLKAFYLQSYSSNQTLFKLHHGDHFPAL